MHGHHLPSEGSSLQDRKCLLSTKSPFVVRHVQVLSQPRTPPAAQLTPVHCCAFVQPRRAFEHRGAVPARMLRSRRTRPSWGGGLITVPASQALRPRPVAWLQRACGCVSWPRCPSPRSGASIPERRRRSGLVLADDQELACPWPAGGAAGCLQTGTRKELRGGGGSRGRARGSWLIGRGSCWRVRVSLNGHPSGVDLGRGDRSVPGLLPSFC